MKYTILINQFAAVTNGLDLDIIDLAIFDFIKDFSNSPKCVKMQTSDGIYFWISHKLILESMPLLNIKTTQGLSKRIDNLIKANIIKKHPDCDKLSKTLYKFGSNYDLLTFVPAADGMITTVIPPNESLTPQTKVVGPPNKSLGVPPNESLGYNNINNNNTINNNKEAPKQSLDATLFPETEEIKEDKAKKTLFANCVWADMNKFIDYFKSQPGMENVDLVYYYHSVSDWSDSKNMKRTARGWLATVRQFMRSDNEKGKLRLNQSVSKHQQTMKYEGATEYLKDFD